VTVHAPARPHAIPATSADTNAPVVVKLGGSVIRSSELTAWLDAIVSARVPVVVVPGGGALADEVRHCQQQLGFGDPSAHRMALLAMDQLAWAVAGLRPGLEVGATEEVLRASLARGLVAVWAPYALISSRGDVEASWRLTSDSLALWLAGRIGATHCYLIKSIAPRRTHLGASALARDGVVDEAFPTMLVDIGVPTSLLARGEQQALAACLSGEAASGARIE